MNNLSQHEINDRGDRWSMVLIGGAVISLVVAFSLFGLQEYASPRPRASTACAYGTPCNTPQRTDTVYDHHRYVCTRRCDVETPGATTGVWNPLGSQEPR